MAVELADAYISLVPSAKGIQAAIARELGSPLDEVAKRSGQKTSKSFWDEWGAQTQVGGAVVAAGVGLLFKSAVGGASDAAEAASKVGVVFGDSADEVKAFAAEAPKAIGASTAEALEMTGTLGNLLVSAGLAGDAAKDMSLDMVQLAGDLGSFNNVPTAEALDAIRSGLVGETEPLKRFGVNLNETTLKAEALALGLSDGKSVLDANAKAQAAYSLILKQTGTAQGDFARTSDGVANKQKILRAEFEDQKAELGQALIPAWQTMLGVGGEVVDLFGKIPAPLQAATVGLAGVTGAALFLGPKVLEGGRAIRDMSAAIPPAIARLKAFNAAQMAGGSSASTMATKVGLIGAAVGGAQIALNELNDWWAEQNTFAAEGADAYQAYFDVVAAGKEPSGELTDQLEDLGVSVWELSSSFRDLDNDDGLKKISFWNRGEAKAARAEFDAWDKALARFAETNAPGAAKAADALYQEIVSLNPDVTREQFDGVFDDYTTAAGTATAATISTKDALGDLKTQAATPQGTAAIDALDKVLGEAEGKLTRAQQAIRDIIIGPDPIRSEIAAQQAIDAVAQVIEDNGTASLSGIATEDQQENRIAFLDARDAIVDYGIALTDAGVAPDEVQRKMKELSDQLGTQAQGVGVTEDAWKSLRTELGLSDKRIELAFSTPGLEKAIGDVERLNWKLIEVNVLASGEQRTGGGYGFNYSDRLPATTQGVNNVSESLGFGNRSRRGTTIINYNGVGIEKADRVAGRMIGRR